MAHVQVLKAGKWLCQLIATISNNGIDTWGKVAECLVAEAVVDTSPSNGHAMVDVRLIVLRIHDKCFYATYVAMGLSQSD